ncbi:MAG: aldo/keto reductase [Oscillospiraceae bacterium]|jgi:L-glyceraldehyde 3-phosphate reductase|nr:aldo/keto reductase [Oscillospiraceae bacterium]
MIYNRLGKSGLKVSAISLGFWQNFGVNDPYDNMKAMVLTAFNEGIVHFDLANNYGNGSILGTAEINFGRIFKNSLEHHRDEVTITTKAGYEMWGGVYGDKNGSRKYLIASLDQSLKRLDLDYVDIFYHHVPDSETPIEETALALDQIVKSGKALYIGISNYNKKQTEEILKIFKELKTPFVVNQVSYSMLERWIEEDGLVDFAKQEGFGLVAFSPLAKGLLSDKYLKGIPSDSRMGKGNPFLKSDVLTEDLVKKLNKLNDFALKRGQTLAQMALSWVLRDTTVASVLIGASRSEQIKENIATLEKPLTSDEITEIGSFLEN